MRQSLLRKEGVSMRKQEEPSDHNGGLTPVKGREQEGGLGRKSPRLQCSFEKVLVRPRGKNRPLEEPHVAWLWSSHWAQ